jgi:hypothetical protein
MGLYLRTSRCSRELLLVIAILLIIVTPVIAAGSDNRIRTGIPAEDVVMVNHAEINRSGLEKFQKSPEPVTLIHAEISDTALPGPRYMAFGPSTIGVSVSPVILSALVVLVFLGIGIWGIRTGSQKRKEPDKEK